MCLAIEYEFKEKNHIYYFNDSNAMLPLLRKNDDIELYPWGRQNEQAGNLPLGNWVTGEAIGQSKWQKYNAKLVRICVKKFAEKDIRGNIRWHELIRGQFILGLMAREKEEVRVYIVTIISHEPKATYKRWPRILSQPRY